MGIRQSVHSRPIALRCPRYVTAPVQTQTQTQTQTHTQPQAQTSTLMQTTVQPQPSHLPSHPAS